MSSIPIEEMKLKAPDTDMLYAQWDEVFDKDAPFYDSYVKHYSQALTYGWPDPLDVHREAIYYIINNEILAKVIARLIRIAVFYPECNFIESLSFFLSDEDNRKKIKEIPVILNSSEIERLSMDIDILSSYYMDTSDEDIAEALMNFQSFLIS